MNIFWTEDVNLSDFDSVLDALDNGRIDEYLSSNNYDLFSECCKIEITKNTKSLIYC